MLGFLCTARSVTFLGFPELSLYDRSIHVDPMVKAFPSLGFEMLDKMFSGRVYFFADRKRLDRLGAEIPPADEVHALTHECEEVSRLLFPESIRNRTFPTG